MKKGWPSISAMLGGLMCIALTPFMASIWSYEGGATRWMDTRLIPRVFGPWLEAAGFLDFAPNYIVYRTLGWLILLSSPAGLWLSIYMIGYVPNGTLFPMAVTWIVLAIRNWEVL